MKKVIITRLFPKERAAIIAARRFVRQGFPRNDIKVIQGSDADMVAALTAHGVNEDTAKAYAAKAGEGAVTLVAATYKPLGAAKIARQAFAAADTVDMGDAVEEVTVKEPMADLRARKGGLVSRSLGLPLIEHRRWGSFGGKENILRTGHYYGSFGGKKNMLRTGQRFGSFGGKENMIKTGTRWGSFGGKENMIKTGTRWGSIGGKANMIWTGKRMGGPAQLLIKRSGRTELMTGKRFGGPVPLISK